MTSQWHSLPPEITKSSYAIQQTSNNSEPVDNDLLSFHALCQVVLVQWSVSISYGNEVLLMRRGYMTGLGLIRLSQPPILFIGTLHATT